MIARIASLRKLALVVSLAFVTTAVANANPLTFSFSAPGGIVANGTFTTSPINLGPYSTIPGYGPALKVDGVTGTFTATGLGISGTFSAVIPATMDYTTVPRPNQYPTAGDSANHGSIGSTGTYPISYDNIIYPGQNSPNVCPNYYSYGGGPLDLFGLLLEVNKTGGGSVLVNLWSNGNLNNPANVLGVDYGLAIGDYVPADANPFQVLTYLGDGNLYESDPASYTGSGVSFQVSVPEIDPAGLGSVVALISGGLGLLERRRKRS